MRTTLAIVALAITVGVFFGDVLVGSRVLITCNTFLWSPWKTYAGQEQLQDKTYRTDAARTYLPRKVELSRSLRSGRFPFWNPYAFAGCPFFSDPQSQAVYPVSLLLSLVDPARAMGYDVAIHFMIAMLGMFLFLRIAGTGPWGAIAGAFAYGFSAFFFLRMGHPTFVAAASWIPFLFYAYEKSKAGERTGTVLLIVFTALAYLAGMPQVFLFGVGALVIYVLHDIVERVIRRDTGSAVRNARVLGIALLLSGLIVAVQLTSFLEFAANSQGPVFDFDMMKQAHVWHPIFLVRALMPDFFGNPVEGTSWVGLVRGVTHPYNSGFMVYCGVGGVLLAMSSLALLVRSSRVRGLWLLLLLSVGLGSSAVLLRLVYALFPWIGYSQIDRVSVIACFAVAALAGKGWSAALGEDGKTHRGLVWVLCGLVGAVAVGTLVFALRGSGLFSGLAVEARRFAADGWFTAGGFRLLGWLDTACGAWFNYEMGQAVRLLLLSLLTLGLVLVYLRRRGRPRTAALIAGLLLLTLVLDLVTAAKTYYVSQPQQALSTTPGIRYLQDALGKDGRWRIGSLEAMETAFPSNIPDVFGIGTFEGTGALYPSGYAERIRWARAAGNVLPDAGCAAGTLGSLMSVRYLVSDRMAAGLVVSPVLFALAADEGSSDSVGIAGFGDDRTLCFRQTLGDSAVVDFTARRAESLDFRIGIDLGDDVPAGGRAAVRLVCASAGNTVAEFEESLDLATDCQAWHDFRVGISELEGPWFRLTLTSSLSGCGAGPRGRLLWGGFDVVLNDCEVDKVGEGYVIGPVPGSSNTVLGLRVHSVEHDMPLWLRSGQDPDRVAVRWLRSGSAGGCDLALDLSDQPTGDILVTSDSAIDVEWAGVMYTPNPQAARFSLVFDRDMFIYENQAAMPKGICIDGRLIASNTPGGLPGRASPRPQIRLSDVAGRITSQVCGRCEIIRYDPERIELAVDADKECLLVLQDTDFPGWAASVDGNRVNTVENDLGIRALELPAGRHEVVMMYRPKLLSVGLALMVVGLVVMVAYASAGRVTVRFGGSRLRPRRDAGC